MSTCCETVRVEAPAGAQKIVLVGNPNVGKSVVFHALTGVYVDVSNFPGTTVEISSGRFGRDVVYDTPGAYGISCFNDEERVTRDMVLQGDVIVNVIDAAHLDRDLFLTLQLIDMGYPMVVALNMMDEAEAHGLKIDVDRLSQELGVEVIPIIAVRGQGLDRLPEALMRARPGNPTPDIMAMLPTAGNRAEAVLVLEDDPDACARQGVEPAGKRETVYRLRRERADWIVEAVVSETNQGASLATRLGRLSIHPVWGPALLIGFLYVVYQLLGVFVAQTVVGVTEEEIMGGIYAPWIYDLVSRVVPPETFLGELLIGEFGLLTMTVTYLLGLLLPLVVGFYLILSFMEDSGYLPRVAVLVDRAMTKVGLNGRAIIPTILGFGCVTMATMTTRLMGTKRERTIATFLLSFAIPCSAQLAVIATMVVPLGFSYMMVFAGLLFLLYGVAGAVANRLLPGQSSDLLIDLPPLRWPRLSNILQKTYLKAKGFLLEAGGVFAAGSLVVATLYYFGVLAWLQGVLAPLTVGWLGLPAEAANAFIMGFVRRDFGAAGLYDLALSPHQTMVALMVITLFAPCIAAIMIMLKERGKREGALIWVTDVVLAFFVGGLLHRVLFW